MKVLVFDFEVFYSDILLGVYDCNNKTYFQTWDEDEIKKYYYENIDAIWVGHNNKEYDNYILQAVVNDENWYKVSKNIIEKHQGYKLNINLNYYDIMQWHPVSLKVLEAYMGKNISESEVDFNIMRPLTGDEKLLTEKYNRDDLDQTYEDLIFDKSKLQLRLDLIKEFNLPLAALHYTEAQIAARTLGAKRLPDDYFLLNHIEPKIYNNLLVNNQKVKDFYLYKDWACKRTLNIDFCGTEHKIAAGGIHAGDLIKTDFAYYLDVSGYYNLIMINFNLLPRSIPEEGKKLYEFMYHEQLRLKKIDPVKRNVYKVILLAVFGAQSNEHCDFYDPDQGDIVRLTGEMFLVDLLEKLEGKVKVIQSNTDGIMIKPINGTTEEELKSITDEWQNRTGFVLKFEKIYNVIQRDVNNYIYKDENGNIHTKGEAVKHWTCDKSPFATDAYNSKEPLIIGKCIVEYFMNNKKPEQVIEENKEDIRLFQYICKTLSYDYLEYKGEKLQKVNRCFASKEPGMIYKCKGEKHDKYSNLPPQVFVWNNKLELYLKERIDYNYYIRRAYERISEFEIKVEQLSLF